MFFDGACLPARLPKIAANSQANANKIAYTTNAITTAKSPIETPAAQAQPRPAAEVTNATNARAETMPNITRSENCGISVRRTSPIHSIVYPPPPLKQGLPPPGTQNQPAANRLH